MKLKYLAVFLGCLLAGCTEEMNFREFTMYEKDYVEENFDKVKALVTKIYTYLDNDFGSYSGAMLASATDEAEYAYTGNSIYTFINGGWSPLAAQSAAWSNCYTAIQQANLFLNEFQGLTFPEHVVDDNYQQNMLQYAHLPAEARALRAYFYFTLAERYGDVPLFTELMTPEKVNSLKRTPVQEVFKFIIDECDAVMNDVPVKWSDIDAALTDGDNAGRINRLFVLALKARTALYAASPLFNPDNDRELWLQAVAANKDVLDFAAVNNCKLLDNYGDIWAETNYQKTDKASEVIFARRLGASNTYEKYNFPTGLEGGNGGNCPTQNLVDAYEMKATGKLWNEAGSGYDPANPYQGRDPRFALTVAFNGEAKWPDYNTSALETFYGGKNGEPLSGATPTGYYLKKMLNRTVTLQAGKENTKLHNWVTFRLGEFYLNYAEAAFKVSGSADAVPQGCTMTAREAVNAIRKRATMPDLETGLSAEAFRQKYSNERFVELAFEGHRFFDLRRLKESDKLKSIIEMKITKEADGTYTYTRKTVNRTWDDKMYLFPIPQSELMKNPNLRPQNPGWGE